MTDTTPETRIAANFLRRPNLRTASGNERQILDLIRRLGPITRADLTRQTELTAQSISRLVDELIDRGLLRTGARILKGRGQPGVAVELVPEAAYTIGISIMTDAVAVVLMDFTGVVLEEQLEPLDTMRRADVIDAIKRIVARLIEKRAIKPTRLFGIGVAITGYFIAAGTRVNPSEHLEDWALIDLKEVLSDAFQLPVWVDNDGNAAATGESLFGVGRWTRSFAYIYVATGLGGGVVIDGKVIEGAAGNSGEFTGILAPNLREDRPTLELLRQMINARGLEISSVSELIARFDPAWPGIEAWIERTRQPLIAIVSAIAAVLDPEAIVIGGRIPPALAKRLADETEFYAVPRRAHPRPLPRLVAAESVGDATAIGAAALPLKHHFFR